MGDRRRIAFVLGTSAGGVGRHVRMLAAGLVREGHAVLVAGPRATEDTFGFTGVGARFTPVPISGRPHPLNDLKAVARLRRATAGAGVVHAHGLRAGALAALGLAGTRTPLAVTLHNAATAGGAVGAVFAALERVVARRADTVLTVSPDLAERMRALGARDVRPAVVPAPALPEPRRTVAETRGDLGVGERPVLLTVARLAQQKGLSELLSVAAGPFDQEPVFLVAGGGPLAGELQARIDREGLPVRLLGDRDDVADLLRVATAVVVPSRWEGQPLSVQEALRAGCPLVATAVGGVPEMVGEAGVLVPYGDVAAMRGAVRDLLGDPALRARLARAALARGAALPGEAEALTSVHTVYVEIARG
ncbi:Glycosyltransferase involved in cell wall bisynthesis [Sinosporangium album]|uniref:Glycosyltransferase involved in cell wall bisynthesis n=1 Tax=Sinosporangium album TaxID=504805 RepID=A0A1G7WGE0_9ACTN|nr:glycosyltransferase family 4 protein [Sinosporangium album]SDG71105.1 Glycosyltransferase involved in cell wall bisynthesis [Sinosporangium album]